MKFRLRIASHARGEVQRDFSRRACRLVGRVPDADGDGRAEHWVAARDHVIPFRRSLVFVLLSLVFENLQGMQVERVFARLSMHLESPVCIGWRMDGDASSIVIRSQEPFVCASRPA